MFLVASIMRATKREARKGGERVLSRKKESERERTRGISPIGITKKASGVSDVAVLSRVSEPKCYKQIEPAVWIFLP